MGGATSWAEATVIPCLVPSIKTAVWHLRMSGGTGLGPELGMPPMECSIGSGTPDGKNLKRFFSISKTSHMISSDNFILHLERGRSCFFLFWSWFWLHVLDGEGDISAISFPYHCWDCIEVSNWKALYVLGMDLAQLFKAGWKKW